MRHLWIVFGLCFWLAAGNSWAGIITIPNAPSNQTPLAPIPDLVCFGKPKVASQPARAPESQPNTAVSEIPDAHEIAEALPPEGMIYPPAPRALELPSSVKNKTNMHLAVWGDSHMAAGYFTEELLRLIAKGQPTANTQFVHAGVGHPGVRGLVRKACLSPEWRRELAHTQTSTTPNLGPGLVSLVSKHSGANLALDLRDVYSKQALHQRVTLLYDVETTEPAVIAITVDGVHHTEVTLSQEHKGQRLTLEAAAPISTLNITLKQGGWRFQGLQYDTPQQTQQALIDVYAYPGSTMTGWAKADSRYVSEWFQNIHYDLILLAYGTNEGNDVGFQDSTYQAMLNEALTNFRRVFPSTPCVLIGPGDRGVSVKSVRTSSKRGGKHKKLALKRKPAVDLFKYSKIHARISRIQAELAPQFGCQSWSLQTSMGAPGSAYLWARKKTPWMAPDLIHFTRAGYVELARSFAAQSGFISQ